MDPAKFFDGYKVTFEVDPGDPSYAVVTLRYRTIPTAPVGGFSDKEAAEQFAAFSAVFAQVFSSGMGDPADLTRNEDTLVSLGAKVSW